MIQLPLSCYFLQFPLTSVHLIPKLFSHDFKRSLEEVIDPEGTLEKEAKEEEDVLDQTPPEEEGTFFLSSKGETFTQQKKSHSMY